MTFEDAEVLRVYLNDDDRFEGRPLFEAIVARAHALGMAGASAFRGGGVRGRRAIRDASSEYAFIGSPVVVEIVDVAERIAALVVELEGMIGKRLATIGVASNPARIARPDDQAA